MTYSNDIGLRWGLYLHGRHIGVSGWSDAWGENCDDQRTVGRILRRSYPFVYAEQPNVIDTFAFGVSYEAIQTKEDASHLRYVRAIGGRLDVCQYKLTTEIWSRDAAFSVVKTMRRLALRTISSLPDGVAAALPEVVKADGNVITEGAGAGKYVVGSADANGRTTITLGTPATKLEFEYVPLLYMTNKAVGTSFPTKLTEDWALTLEEVV